MGRNTGRLSHPSARSFQAGRQQSLARRMASTGSYSTVWNVKAWKPSAEGFLQKQALIRRVSLGL